MKYFISIQSNKSPNYLPRSFSIYFSRIPIIFNVIDQTIYNYITMLFVENNLVYLMQGKIVNLNQI